MLDESVLNQLEQDVGSDVIKMLLLTFINETAERLEIIKALSMKNQWEALGKEGHTLKSTAGSFGLLPLHHMAKKLDESCREKNFETAAQLSKEIPKFGAESLATLRDWMDAHQ